MRVHSAFHFDTLHAPELWDLIAVRTGVPGGAARVAAATIHPSPSWGHARWILPEGRGTQLRQRWCPRCLAADTTPYFRRAWRLAWVLWCPIDGARMRDSCPACGARLGFRLTAWDQPLTSCWQCGAGLCVDVPDGAAPSPLVQTATVASLAHLDRLTTDDFQALLLLKRLVWRLGPALWPELLARLGLTEAAALPAPESLRNDEREAFQFAVAWHMLVVDPAAIQTVARSYQKDFNQAFHKYRAAGLSTTCQPLRQAFPELTTSDVEAAIKTLINRGEAVSYKSVSGVLGLGAGVLARRPQLRKVVDRAAPRVQNGETPASRAAYRVQPVWLARIRAALAEARDRLVARFDRVTRTALSRESGVQLHVLKQFERVSGERCEEDPADTYRACVESAITVLRERGSRITYQTVAAELAMPHGFLKRNRQLASIVRDSARLPLTLDGVKAAIEALRARGVRVSVAAVARELGHGPAAIESRSWLLGRVRRAECGDTGHG